MGTVDTSYTDEYGIKEMLDKSVEILKDASIVKERQLVNKFIEKISTNSLATYGYNEVIDAIKQGKAETVLVSEKLEWHIYMYYCASCNNKDYKIIKDKNKLENAQSNCSFCKEKIDEEETEIKDIYEYFFEISLNFGTKVVLVSVDTPEGNQFYITFGGLGALLRYK